MSYTILSEATHVARKTHRCIWCGEQIAVGETYRRVKIAYDGELHDNKFHPECDQDCVESAREEGGFIEFMPYSAPRPERTKP